MSKRPTIPDLAKIAGVSISTVNRVIHSAESVREPTRERVLQAAKQIGFYGVRTIEHAIEGSRETHRLGILLQQGARTFYRNLGAAMQKAADEYPFGNVELEIEFLDDLSPDNVAERLTALGETSESVALVAAEHPRVSEAIEALLGNGVPVTGVITPLSARGNVGFVGLDYWKVGRTAAWAFDKMVHSPGKIAILVGNHRYRNQELNESGFRSYFREHNREFKILDAISTYESAAVAREIVEGLLHEHADLCGIFISGGGITGALTALREGKHREDFATVGYELFDATRAGLIDSTLTMAISHPIEKFARETIATMIKAKKAGPDAGAQRVTLDFEIYTSENV